MLIGRSSRGSILVELSLSPLHQHILKLSLGYWTSNDHNTSTFFILRDAIFSLHLQKMSPKRKGPPKSGGRPAKRTRAKNSLAETSLAIRQMTGSPACPGVVKTRPQGPLSKLPPGSDIFEAFARLRRDKELSDDEAFLEFLSTYDVPLTLILRVSGNLFLFTIKVVSRSHDCGREIRMSLFQSDI